jgi:hypothetical protein
MRCIGQLFLAFVRILVILMFMQIEQQLSALAQGADRFMAESGSCWSEYAEPDDNAAEQLWAACSPEVIQALCAVVAAARAFEVEVVGEKRGHILFNGAGDIQRALARLDALQGGDHA